MNDPHVDKLHYKVVAPNSEKFDKAAPATWTYQDFSVRIAPGGAIFTMIKHFADESEAKACVQQFVNAWCVSTGLERLPDDFLLEYQHADIVDRRPRPGEIVVRLSAAGFKATAQDVKFPVDRLHFPEPPASFKVTPLVEVMYHQYKLLRKTGTFFAAVGNFCLTAMEVLGDGNRAKAAGALKISGGVLKELGKLTGGAGGNEARKVVGIGQPYTDQEKEWIIQTIRALIRRVAEYEADPNGNWGQITLTDLPSK